MKRLATIAVMLAVLASCSKQSEFVTARLDFTVSDNSMTKVTTADVQSAVEDAVRDLPVRMSYGGAGKSTQRCNAGDVVTLPVGKVYVGLEYIGEAQEREDVLFYDEPYFYADTTVDFHSYYSELVVRAHFRCAMVVVNPSEVEDISLNGEALNLADYGSFRAFYVYSDIPGSAADLTVYAKGQTDFEDRIVTLNTAQLEYGKWYMLSPTGITHKDAEMNFEIDGFEEGGRI